MFGKQRKTDTKDEGRGTKDETENRPSSLIPRLSCFRLVTPVFLALFTSFLLIRTAAVISAPQSFSAGGARTDYTVWLAALLALAVRGIMGRLMAMGVAMFKVKEAQYEQNGKTKKNHHNHGQSPHSLGWIRVMGTGWNKITNDDAGRFYGDGRNRSWPKRLLRIRPVRLRLPLSLPSFFWSDNDTGNQKNDPQSGHSDSNDKRKFFKEICGQPNGYNRFAKVGNHFSDKFPALITNNNHRLNNIMPVKQCQAEVRPVRVIGR